MPGKAKAAVIGWGTSELSRKPGGTITDLAREAIENAVVAAGIDWPEIDGLILGQSDILERSALSATFRHSLDLGNLSLLTVSEAKGTTVLQAIQQASLAVHAGMARTVVCVFSDTPISAAASAGETFARPSRIMNVNGWEERYGCFGAIGAYALAASAYRARYGLDDEAFGHYAIACRKWAALNPRALFQENLTMDAYLAAPFIAEPLRLLDCAAPVNGAAAFIVSSIDAAPRAKAAPVFVHGFGQGHNKESALSALCNGGQTGAGPAAAKALAMAGVSHRDIGICQLYDAFSFSGLYALEAFGFFPPGEAPALVAAGETSPGGALPTNTGGGHLSGYYLQGATPLAEALVQARGSAGARQVEGNDLVFVSNSGGCLEYHATLVVSRHARLS